MKPKLDGSHDDIPDLHTAVHPRTQKWMEDRLAPLVKDLVEEGGVEALHEVLIEAAEMMEDHLRVHDPENELLVMLDEHRQKEQGFC